MSVHFLTPTAGLVALAVVLPLALVAVGELRNRRARAALGLVAPRPAARLELPVAILLLGAALGLAAAQPVLRSQKARLTRTDAEAYVAVDISRSMLAAGSARGEIRLQRAKTIARRLRAGLADTPTGLATFTDRALPLLPPSPDAEAFTSSVEQAIGIEQPPPRSTSVTISSFDAILPIPVSGFFRPGVPHRLLVLVTDAEFENFDAGLLRENFSRQPQVGVIVIRVGHEGERVFGPDGQPEPGYVPPPISGQSLRVFLQATHGREFGEQQVSAAVHTARSMLGTGPRRRLGTVSGRTDLAPYVVVAAVLPLGLVLRRRNL